MSSANTITHRKSFPRRLQLGGLISGSDYGISSSPALAGAGLGRYASGEQTPAHPSSFVNRDQDYFRTPKSAAGYDLEAEASHPPQSCSVESHEVRGPTGCDVECYRCDYRAAGFTTGFIINQFGKRGGRGLSRPTLAFVRCGAILLTRASRQPTRGFRILSSVADCAVQGRRMKRLAPDGAL